MTVRILQGDCRDVLRTLPDASVHCIVTSPPYWGLRDYGVDGQIGLEQTPAEFVEQIVAVMRECRRVLRDDGTLWLNLGDSYTGSANNGGIDSKTMAGPQAATGRNLPTKRGIGLKSKDLIGVPWRVAFALQQPYYTGRVRNEIDRVWLAAMIDGEGCLFIHKRKAGSDSGARYTRADGETVSYARTADTYGAGLEVANTHRGIVERCQEITGLGTITTQDKDRRQTLYRWHLRGDEARSITREVYPYLVAKQHQARLLCGCPTSGEQANAAHQALIGLHGGTPTDVDFKAPASMLEPGWYLRQDCIWSKLNPMPESVTDRCTKAHEYLFLLAKSERYYFDSAAMQEPATGTNAHDVSGGYMAGIVPGATPQSGTRKSGNKERKPASARGVPVDTDGRSAGAVAGSVPWEGFTRNKRSVWHVATAPFAEAHFATFPPALIEPCIQAGCPEGGTVLDPFGGAGTTGLVADRLHRNALLIELNREYVEIARRRIAADAPLFAEVAA